MDCNWARTSSMVGIPFNGPNLVPWVHSVFEAYFGAENNSCWRDARFHDRLKPTPPRLWKRTASYRFPKQLQPFHNQLHGQQGITDFNSRKKRLKVRIVHGSKSLGDRKNLVEFTPRHDLQRLNDY